ncbi:DUF4132 domain-containing protein [Kineosporia babensis]|uniref:DUF4132 domain-containing protein n=1 Tax=Kineosporia babensis TaxID=499548 RepID=A0A9X1SZM8_9ACTN|nr:DUF4132 domain-containing protein [Kineosporia babensis]MCD5312088.1 DUF4132 domain-containing protein [Kineosporia babensis]
MRDFSFTPTWQRHLTPRRGSLGAATFTPVPRAGETIRALLDQQAADVESMLSMSSADLREAAVVLRDGLENATPLAAALQALALVHRWDVKEHKAPFADYWLSERGLPFAVEAAVELMGLCIDTGGNGLRSLRPGEKIESGYWLPQAQVTLRVRAALAVASDAEYDEIIGRLKAHRSRHEYHRLATSLLAPTETAWVEEDIAATAAVGDDYRGFALTQALSTLEQMERLEKAVRAPWYFLWVVTGSHAYVATLTDALGTGVLPVLLRWFDEKELDTEARRRILSVIAQMPAEAAIQALADRVSEKFVLPALLEASERFPALALKVLAAAGSRGQLAELLTAHVRTNRELAQHELAALPSEAASRVRAVLQDAVALDEAPAQALPPLLVTPPWVNRAKVAKPVVVGGLSCADVPVISWLEQEQEKFGVHTGFDFSNDSHSWEERAQGVLRGSSFWWEGPAFFALAPEELARPLLAEWTPHEYTEADDLGPVVARFGVAALPALIRRARQSPSLVGPVLMPLAAPVLAVLMADWLARLKSVRSLAATWLLRHAEPAARALVPPALGKAGTARRQAENALLYLSTHGRRESVEEAARGYGEQAEAAITVLLERDPLSLLPSKVPAQPVWVQAAVLPPVRLRDGSGVLPASALEHLVTVFALSRMDQPYAGLEVVREAVLPQDLAGFAWQLFQRWFAAGAVAKDNWALDALALAGDDEAVRKLTPMILAWPGEGGHARAVTGVAVLAGIGTDVALMHLHNIAQRAKFKGLKTAAQAKMSEVAEALGLTSEQLADRLVPGLGLAADGSLRLDYGPRQFVVGFDEQLKPYVADASGKRLKSLPKPGAKDDPELAPAAYQQFSALKKDVRRIGPDVIRRLERAMVTSRRWSGAEFRQLFVEHPLLWHIVRRLVWGQYDEQDQLIGTLRVAEDRTFADADDEEVTLSDDAVVGVLHPLQAGADVPLWAEVLADYEILQPFAQLARPVFVLTEKEAADGRVERFEGLKIPSRKLLSLEQRGWLREDPMDAGYQGSMQVSFDSGVECGIQLEPGLIVGDPDFWEEQTLSDVSLSARSAWATEQIRAGRPFPLRERDLIAVSEILRDLTDITQPSA